MSLLQDLTTLKQGDGLILWFTQWWSLIRMATLRREPKEHSLMEEQKDSRDKLES